LAIYIGICIFAFYCKRFENAIPVEEKRFMDISIFRIISKVGFIFVIIGFYMPIILDQNVIQISKNLSSELSNTIATPLSVIFVFSFFGAILFFLQLIKEVPIVIDWIIIVTTIIAMTIMHSKILKILESLNLRDNILKNIQSGTYMIIIGLIVSLIFNSIASYEPIKKMMTAFIREKEGGNKQPQSRSLRY
jgi:magnesium-transporting ATPase (P-type)